MSRNWRWMYNPFEKLAGWEAFYIGLIAMCIATVLGYYGHTVFYGLSAKSVPTVTWCRVFSLQVLGLSVTIFVMWVIALLAAKHVRFQDILGTVTLAKYPLILAAIVFLSFGKWLNELNKKLMSMDVYKIINEITVSDYVLIFALSVITIPIFVWEIALLFNAFKVSTNLKGGKCAFLFITALLISEMIINVIVIY